MRLQVLSENFNIVVNGVVRDFGGKDQSVNQPINFMSAMNILTTPI